MVCLKMCSAGWYDYCYSWLYKSMVWLSPDYCHYVKNMHQSKHERLKYYGLIYSITGGGSKKDDAEKQKEDVLNIFSVASGHLYERFLRWVPFRSLTHVTSLFVPIVKLTDRSFYLRIMMLSVLRHTKTPVKFWFLKNYLSPSFKVLPSLHDPMKAFCFSLLVQNNLSPFF